MAVSVLQLLQALDTLTGDHATLERVRDLVANFLPAASKKSRRVNVAMAMHKADAKRRDMAFALRDRFGVSMATAYRDIDAALSQNRPPCEKTRA